MRGDARRGDRSRKWCVLTAGWLGAIALMGSPTSIALPQSPGPLAAMPREIDLRVELRPELPVLRVEATLSFEAQRPLEEVEFRMRSDLQVDVVEDAGGVPLVYRRGPGRLIVSTPLLEAGTIARWRFVYRMRLSEPPRASGQLVSVSPWYPHFRYPTATHEFPRNVPMPATVSATLPEPWMIVAAGTFETESEGEMRTFTWRDGVPSAIVPLLVARLEQHDLEEGRRSLFRAFFPPAHIAMVETHLDYMTRAIRFYTDLLGAHRRRTFSLVGLDLPERVGGLSAPGVTVMPARHSDPETPFPYRIFAHEIAHHWWNDSAGIPLRADGWLREGLPTYSALLFLEQEYGPPMFRQELERSRRVALSVDDRVALAASFRSEDPEAAYALNYHRAAFVLHMLRDVIGRDAFRSLLRASHDAGPGLTTTAFLQRAEQLHGEELSWFLDAWVRDGRVPRFAVRFDQREVAEEVSPFLLTAEIDQEGAAVRHPVLVQVSLEGAPPVERRVWVGPGRTSFAIGLPSPAEALEFDPYGDLLHRGVRVERVTMPTRR